MHMFLCGNLQNMYSILTAIALPSLAFAVSHALSTPQFPVSKRQLNSTGQAASGPVVDLGYEVYQGVANSSTNLNTFRGCVKPILSSSASIQLTRTPQASVTPLLQLAPIDGNCLKSRPEIAVRSCPQQKSQLGALKVPKLLTFGIPAQTYRMPAFYRKNAQALLLPSHNCLVMKTVSSSTFMHRRIKQICPCLSGFVRHKLQ